MGAKSPNWAKIEKEYVTSEISLRQLGKKHGISLSALNRRSRERGWVAKRTAHQNAVTDAAARKLCAGEIDEQADRTARVMQVADKLLTLCERLCESEEVGARDLKSLTAALQDIKEIQMIRSALDIREQQARIKNLERQANADEEAEGETGIIILPEIKHG